MYCIKSEIVSTRNRSTFALYRSTYLSNQVDVKEVEEKTE